MESRRKDEQDLFQIEADTTVKNSEIKNLEVRERPEKVLNSIEN